MCVCVASRYSFGDVLFHGCEWSLFQLDLLLFGVIEVVSNSYPLAAVITLLVSWVSCYTNIDNVCVEALPLLPLSSVGGVCEGLLWSKEHC